jgi:hypothetical protein
MYVGPPDAGKKTSLLHAVVQLRGALASRSEGGFVTSGIDVAVSVHHADDPHGLLYADGFVFVLDDRPERLDGALHAMVRLETELADVGGSLERTPVAVQLDARGGDAALPLRTVVPKLAVPVCSYFKSCAREGRGVTEPLLWLVGLPRRRDRQ